MSATSNLSKLAKAKQDVVAARAKYEDIAKLERERVGKLFEELGFLEVGDAEIISALLYFQNAKPQEQARIISVIRAEAPHRFRKKLTNRIEKLNPSQGAGSPSSDPIGETEDARASAE